MFPTFSFHNIVKNLTKICVTSKDTGNLHAQFWKLGDKQETWELLITLMFIVQISYYHYILSLIHTFLGFDCDMFVQTIKKALKCLHPISFGRDLQTTEILYKRTNVPTRKNICGDI